MARLEVKTPKGVCCPDAGGFHPYNLSCLKCAAKDGIPTMLCQKAAERRNPPIEKYKKFILFCRKSS